MTTPITLPSGSYLAVTVPVDATRFCINVFNNGSPELGMDADEWEDWRHLDLPPGQYELIGLAKEISREQAWDMVEFNPKKHTIINPLITLETYIKSNGLELETTVILKIK
jgi:hypothetical protein